MIQRIQTVYYALAMLCVAVASFGTSIYQFQAKELRYELTAFGLYEYEELDTLTAFQSTPYYVAGLVLLVLLFLTIMSYKNLKRQLTLGRLIVPLYFVLLTLAVFGSMLGTYLTGESEVVRSLGVGFFFFIVGLPLVLLGNIGVKRDKNLLDSVDRIR